MSFDAEPTIGSRYRDLESDKEIQIIALDEYEGVVTLQRDESEVEEQLSLDEWYEMSLEPTGEEGWEEETSSTDDEMNYDDDFDDE